MASNTRINGDSMTSFHGVVLDGPALRGRCRFSLFGTKDLPCLIRIEDWVMCLAIGGDYRIDVVPGLGNVRHAIPAMYHCVFSGVVTRKRKPDVAGEFFEQPSQVMDSAVYILADIAGILVESLSCRGNYLH